MSSLTSKSPRPQWDVSSRTLRGVALVLGLLLGATLASWWVARKVTAGLPEDPFVYPEQDLDYEQIDWVAYQERHDELVKGGAHYEPLRAVVEIPGDFESAEKFSNALDAPGTTEIIGFHVDGQAYAFCIDHLLDIPHHVINFKLGEQPIAVSYCDLSGCARVLSSDRTTAEPLGIGGLDVNNELVFLFEGERYSQRSRDLPMQDIPFQRMTLERWTAEFPETLIFQGNQEST